VAAILKMAATPILCRILGDSISRIVQDTFVYMCKPILEHFTLTYILEWNYFEKKVVEFDQILLNMQIRNMQMSKFAYFVISNESTWKHLSFDVSIIMIGYLVRNIWLNSFFILLTLRWEAAILKMAATAILCRISGGSISGIVQDTFI